ncbi:hypothetical protein HAX54_002266 [Datura stramonium]|uniref:Inhibitor I9 domain-containing protein n=1 Tax=Datura stramonium TaxID=4076 RepID=A0ABS8WT98_DATST|nr:hypothetical protein [Datura stramonium]
MGENSASLCLLSVVLFMILLSPTLAIKKSYVVYMGAHSHGKEVSSIHYDRVTDSHHEFLGSYLGSTENAKEAIFYSYTRHINGFSAMLDDELAAEISKHPQVISAFENRGRKLHTTRSWNLGLEHNNGIIHPSSWKSRFGEDTIIGNLDTVRVHDDSFCFLLHYDICCFLPILNFLSDGELWDPVPGPGIRKLLVMKDWGQFHQSGEEFAKVILIPPFIAIGSHNLSKAGGSFVEGLRFRHGNGTAKGGSPKARVAAYRVCWTPLRAMSALMQISWLHLIWQFMMAWTCFLYHWEERQELMSMTVLLSFPSYVTLGNNKHYKGESLSVEALPKGKFFPIISAASAKLLMLEPQLCKAGALDPKKVKGTILVCLRGENARAGIQGPASCSGRCSWSGSSQRFCIW